VEETKTAVIPYEPEPPKEEFAVIRTHGKLITDIMTTDMSGSSRVTIKCSELLDFTSLRQPMTSNIVVYFPEALLASNRTDYSTENDIIKSITASEANVNGANSKVLIKLNKTTPYIIKRNGNDLILNFFK